MEKNQEEGILRMSYQRAHTVYRVARDAETATPADTLFGVLSAGWNPNTLREAEAKGGVHDES